MKKLLLSMAAIVAATALQAEQKSVTFDFTKPALYGYAAPGAGQGTPVTTITYDGVTISNVGNLEKTDAVRFWNTSGNITFRVAGEGAIEIQAGEASLVALSFSGNNIEPAVNFVASDSEGWNYDGATKTATWSGKIDKMVITREKSTVTMTTMTVTYEAEDAVEPGDDPAVEPQGIPETFAAIAWPTEDLNGDGEVNASDLAACDVFANAVIENGASTVNFGTANITVEAVGGTTAKDVYQEAGTDFAGWTEWNDVKWDIKNQGDIQFAYILGTGNPAVAFDAEEVLTEEQRTGHYRPVYTYYEADGSKGMPVMGLYYKFMPKVDGQLKVNVWSNKGNRFTFFVDEDTQKPVKYQAEGYINGQNDENGAKRWLSAEEIQYIHDQAKCEKDADGNIVPGTDSAPWVIGAGNQPAWVTLTVSVKAGKKYWLFQHSSQIGFQSYTFTPNEAGAGISEVVAEQNDAIFNLRGERVSSMNRGQMYIKNGKKIVIR